MDNKKKLTKAVDIEVKDYKSISTTFSILDNWWSFNGGIIQGRLYYLTGSSGAGKTTFLTLLQSKMSGIKSSQYNRESTVDMVKSRNSNLDYHDNFYMDDESTFPTLEEYLEYAEKENFDMLIIDSARAAAHNIEGGSLAKEVAAIRMGLGWVKRTGKNIFFIGMVTKDDVFAGSNDIMHYCDAHIHLQFDKKNNERYMFFDQKNRDGNIGQKIYYNFREDGLGLNFFTEQEWATQKRGEKLDSVIQNSIENWISGWSSHKNFPKFKIELSKVQNDILNKHQISSQIEFQSKLLVEINLLANKFFFVD